jgi:hypothetical protein
MKIHFIYFIFQFLIAAQIKIAFRTTPFHLPAKSTYWHNKYPTWAGQTTAHDSILTRAVVPTVGCPPSN